MKVEIASRRFAFRLQIDKEEIGLFVALVVLLVKLALHR